jgi:hypothetical protein
MYSCCAYIWKSLAQVNSVHAIYETDKVINCFFFFSFNLLFISTKMLSTLFKSKSTRLLPTRSVFSSLKTASTSRGYITTRSCNQQGLVNSTRHSLILQSASLRPTTTMTKKNKSITLLRRQQQRSFSLWNIPLSLMTASPLKRRLTLVALGGTSLAAAVILGPILLVGLGGIAAVIGFRFWRFRNQLIKQANSQGGDWPDFLNAFIQQQQVFGKDQLKVEKEALKRLEIWSQSDQGRNRLIEYGIHPERVVKNVFMRGSSYASISTSSSSSSNKSTEIKIELDLRNSPGSVLIATAQLDREKEMTMTDIKLVTPTGHVLRIPLSIRGSTGRIIEGEFRDIQ